LSRFAKPVDRVNTRLRIETAAFLHSGEKQ
jgi:hypothetical protein